MSVVPYSLSFHGLISAPTFPERPAVICWLRLFHKEEQASPEFVAVLTEVPGNPGGSISNQHEFVADHLKRDFGVEFGSLTLFHVWPTDLLDSPSWTENDPNTATQIRSTTRADVEQLVGNRLPDLPSHEDLYPRIGEMGGGIWEEHFRPLFQAFPLAQLPPPHNPSGCEHIARFRIMRAAAEEQFDDQEAIERVAGQEFLGSLSPEDRAACWRHDGNWKTIADASAAILDRLGRCDPIDYVVAAEALHLAEREEWWLTSLFDDPILIGGDGFTNGQHRACALRFSGAERAAIHVADESLGLECIDWTFVDEG
jgi:hypothetical protein